MRFFFLLYLLPLSGYAQKVIVSNPKTNILYAGIENPLEVLVNKSNCNNFTLASPDGNTQPGETPCLYTFTSSRTGRTSIYVVDKNSKKTIDTIPFRVAEIPAPVAIVAGKNGGNISRTEMKAQMGMIARYEGFDFDAKAKILGYTIVILRGRSVVFLKVCEGALFPQDVTAAFGTLKKNDKIVFSGIQCLTADMKSRSLQAVEFTITE